ncbi:MAG TPA: M20/M25/M40 family metallo-hydrolase, partial [Candidatus Dormibacteraeota bacterium]
MLDKALDRARSNHDGDVAEWFDELRIPSIATAPDHRADTIRNAEWLVERFQAAGLESDLWGAEGGMPIVRAEWRGRPGAPTATIYGHYDVQPADPLELWTSPPFEPTVRDGRVYARGAADSKVNHFAALKAAEHAIAAGGPPVNIRFLIEGEEEGGGTVL